MRYPAIAAAFYNTPHAVTPEKLEEVRAYLEGRFRGDFAAWDEDGPRNPAAGPRETGPARAGGGPFGASPAASLAGRSWRGVHPPRLPLRAAGAGGWAHRTVPGEGLRCRVGPGAQLGPPGWAHQASTGRPRSLRLCMARRMAPGMLRRSRHRALQVDMPARPCTARTGRRSSTARAGGRATTGSRRVRQGGSGMRASPAQGEVPKGRVREKRHVVPPRAACGPRGPCGPYPGSCRDRGADVNVPPCFVGDKGSVRGVGFMLRFIWGLHSSCT